MIEIKTWEDLEECDNVDLKTYLKNVAEEYQPIELSDLVGDSVFIVESLEDLKQLRTFDGTLYDSPCAMEDITSFVDKYSFFYYAYHTGGGWLAVIPAELIRDFPPLSVTVRLTYAQDYK